MQPTTALLASAIALVTTSSHAILPITLSGNQSTDNWTGLTATNHPGYPNPFNPAAPSDWPAPITADAGDAGFDRLSGLGYPASTSIYNFESVSSYEVTDNTLLTGLETLVLQLDHGGGITSAPVLSYNGGSQALAADFSASIAGDFTVSFGGSNSPSVNNLYEWDLSGVSGAISEYEITYATGFHDSLFALRVDQGDNFTGSTIPEPASATVLVALWAGLLARRRTR